MDDTHARVLTITATVSSTLSMAGSLGILSKNINLPGHRRKELGERMVVIESVLDFFASLTFSFGAAFVPKEGVSPNAACICQAWFVQFFLAAVCWNAVMAANFYALVVLRMNARRLRRKLFHELAALVLFTGAIAIILLFLYGYPGVYGGATLWCWVTQKHVAAQLSAFYSVVLLCWTICIYLLIEVGKAGSTPLIAISHHHDEEENPSAGPRTLTAQTEAATAAKESAAAVRSRLSKYVAAFVWVWTFGLLNRISSAILNALHKEPIYAFAFLQVFFIPLQGFFNFLIYLGYVDDFLAWCCRLIEGARCYSIHKQDGDGVTDRKRVTARARRETARGAVSAAGGWDSCDFGGTGEELSAAKKGRRGIFVTTFNVGESQLDEENINSWLPLGFDVYAVGVQECLDLPALRNKMLRHLNKDGWSYPLEQHAIQNENLDQGAFVMHCRELGSNNTSLGFHGMIALTLFLRRDEVDAGVAVVEQHAVNPVVPMGQALVGGVRAPNKGGCGIAVKYHDSTLAFLTAHFASDSGGKLRPRVRNAQTAELLSSCVLTADDVGSDVHLGHHHVFCFGDFNYRVANFANPDDILDVLHGICLAESFDEKEAWGGCGVPPEWSWRTRRWDHVVEAAKAADALSAEAKGDGLGGDLPWAVAGSDVSISMASLVRWKPLLEHDELGCARAIGAIFLDFVEVPIVFPPTFRRRRGPLGDPGDYTNRQTLGRAFVVDLKGEENNDMLDDDGGGDGGGGGELYAKPKSESEDDGGTSDATNSEVAFELKTLLGSTRSLTAPETERLEKIMGLQQSGVTGIDDPLDNLEGHLDSEPANGDGTGFANEGRSKHLRPPSWTDRVLVHSLEDVRGLLELEAYESTDAIDVSDHRPVALVAVLAIDEEWDRDAVESSAISLSDSAGALPDEEMMASSRNEGQTLHQEGGDFGAASALPIPPHKTPVPRSTRSSVHVKVSISSPRLVGKMESSFNAWKRISNMLYENSYYTAAEVHKQRNRQDLPSQAKITPENNQEDLVVREISDDVSNHEKDAMKHNYAGAVDVALVFPIPAEDPFLEHRKVFDTAAEAIPGANARKKRDTMMAFTCAGAEGRAKKVTVPRSDVLGNKKSVSIEQFFEGGENLVKISDVVPSRGMHALLKFMDADGSTLAASCICLATVAKAQLEQSQGDSQRNTNVGPVPVEIEVTLTTGGQVRGKLAIDVTCEKVWRV